MPDLVIPEEAPATAKLTNVLRDVVREFTRMQPMQIEEIVECLAFTTGFAIGNRPIQQGKLTNDKILRNLAVDRLDKGLDAGRTNRGAMSIIMPSAENTNRVGALKSTEKPAETGPTISAIGVADDREKAPLASPEPIQ